MNAKSWSVAGRDMAVDLGPRTRSSTSAASGIVLNEPSVVAIDVLDGEAARRRRTRRSG